jgi:phosphoenolpyruvate carboxykinase (ATP)
MPLHPKVYGRLLEERLKASGARTYLLNTGWTGGPYGVGKRIDIASTRRLLDAALSGELDDAQMRIDPVFGFEVPVAVPEIASRLLDPRQCWPDPVAYDAAAQALLARFVANFRKFDEDVTQAAE